MPTGTSARDLAPPVFLQLVGHRLRWRLLTELARSDRQVRELTRAVGRPQSLVSYHLGRLRSGGLVSMRRSSFDGRDAYYRVDLGRCGELLATTGAALHPAFRMPSPPAAPPCAPLCPARPAPPPRRPRAAARGRRGSCSCAPATARARRWPKPCWNISR